MGGKAGADREGKRGKAHSGAGFQIVFHGFGSSDERDPGRARPVTLPQESGVDQAFIDAGGAREPTGGPRGAWTKRTSKTGAVSVAPIETGAFTLTGSGSVAAKASRQAGQSWPLSVGAGFDFLAINCASSAPTWRPAAACTPSPGRAHRTAGISPGRADAAAIIPGIRAWEISAITARARARRVERCCHMGASIITNRGRAKSLNRRRPSPCLQRQIPLAEPLADPVGLP